MNIIAILIGVVLGLLGVAMALFWYYRYWKIKSEIEAVRKQVMGAMDKEMKLENDRLRTLLVIAGVKLVKAGDGMEKIISVMGDIPGNNIHFKEIYEIAKTTKDLLKKTDEKQVQKLHLNKDG